MKLLLNESWQPDADEALYGEGGFYEAADTYAQAGNVLRGLAEIGKIGWLPRWLDVGCGDGALVEQLRAIGFDAEGYDPITRPDYPEGPYDMAISVHVLEHVADPIEFIDFMKHEIADHGYICIVCHNVIGRPNVRARKPWHKWFFGRNLMTLLKARGFDIIGRITWGGYPAPRKVWQEWVNQARKRLGLGDVQMVIGRRG